MKGLKVFIVTIVGVLFCFVFSYGVLKSLYPIKYYKYIEKYSSMYNLDKYLV